MCESLCVCSPTLSYLHTHTDTQILLSQQKMPAGWPFLLSLSHSHMPHLTLSFCHPLSRLTNFFRYVCVCAYSSNKSTPACRSLCVRVRLCVSLSPINVVGFAAKNVCYESVVLIHCSSVDRVSCCCLSVLLLSCRRRRVF